MAAKDGMFYAAKGKPDPVVKPGEFVFSAVGLDHGHIYGMTSGLLDAGATLKYVYDPDPQKVEAYRKDLVMNRYQQELVNQKLAGDISEQELESYYLDNRQLFTVDRPLIKGLFIKVPLTAPHVANVRRWYRQEEREAVEHLEKYSLRNAVKYEYFYDKWVPVAEVLDLLPLKHAEPETYLEKNRHVELKDTAFYYFLNVSDYRAVGEPEPYEVARAHARDMLLNTRRAAFLRQVRHDLYDNALESNDIVYYIGRTEQR